MIEVRVSDVRQWEFCPRVLWHRWMLGKAVRETGKMILGQEAETALLALEKRRTAHRFGLQRAERRTAVPLSSERLGVRGLCDLVLDVPEQEDLWPRFKEAPEGLKRVALRKPRQLLPVEIKRTENGMGRHHALQLTGYALLLEEQEGLGEGAVQYGFVYLIPSETVVTVRMGAKLRTAFKRAVQEIREALEHEHFPKPTRYRSYCPDCEFLNFCGDVL